MRNLNLLFLCTLSLLAAGCDPTPIETPGPGTAPVEAKPSDSNVPELTDAAKAALAESEKQRFEKSRFYVAHDMFIAADDPRTVSASVADKFLEDSHEVLGFVVNDTPRAYSVRMLAYHHVVNDVIAGKAITVTY